MIDVASGCERRAASGSYCNPLEAQAAVAVLRRLVNEFGVDVGTDAVIITFYAAQVCAVGSDCVAVQ